MGEEKAKALEQEYLVRLEVAFEENAQLAEVAIERGMNDSLKLEQFIHMSPEEAKKIPSDQNFSYLRSLWRPKGSARSPSEQESRFEKEFRGTQ